LSPRAALVLVALVAACGDDAGDASGPATYDVVLVVGAAEPPLVEVGSEFSEPWTLDCVDDTCTLVRDGGEPLGDLTELRLERVGDGFVGAAVGVTSTEPASCPETWAVEIELAVEDGLVVGSIARVPSGECAGVDLTLGFSGATTVP
jgi:hypothetical protein